MGQMVIEYDTLALSQQVRQRQESHAQTQWDRIARSQ